MILLCHAYPSWFEYERASVIHLHLQLCSLLYTPVLETLYIVSVRQCTLDYNPPSHIFANTYTHCIGTKAMCVRRENAHISFVYIMLRGTCMSLFHLCIKWLWYVCVHTSSSQHVLCTVMNQLLIVNIVVKASLWMDEVSAGVGVLGD